MREFRNRVKKKKKKKRGIHRGERKKLIHITTV
jgi:hypothetical protein